MNDSPPTLKREIMLRSGLQNIQRCGVPQPRDDKRTHRRTRPGNGCLCLYCDPFGTGNKARLAATKTLTSGRPTSTSNASEGHTP